MASLGTTFNRQMFTVEGSAVRLGAAASAASGRADRRSWPSAGLTMPPTAARQGASSPEADDHCLHQ